MFPLNIKIVGGQLSLFQCYQDTHNERTKEVHNKQLEWPGWASPMEVTAKCEYNERFIDVYRFISNHPLCRLYPCSNTASSVHARINSSMQAVLLLVLTREDSLVDTYICVTLHCFFDST